MKQQLYQTSDKVKIDSQNCQTPQEIINSDSKEETHTKKKEYTGETGAPFSSIVPSTVQDTKQQMISESLSVSAKNLKVESLK